MAADAGTVKILELLPRHFDHRHDPYIGRSGSQLIRAIRRQRETKIEHLAEFDVGRAQQSPNQRDRIEVTDRAHARLCNGVLLKQPYSLTGSANQPWLRLPAHPAQRR